MNGKSTGEHMCIYVLPSRRRENIYTRKERGRKEKYGKEEK